jgi:hypothetical protein
MVPMLRYGEARVPGWFIKPVLRFSPGALLVLAMTSLSGYAEQLPVVPNPQGFIEASTLSAIIRNAALAGHPSWQKLIGVYYEPDALAKILNTGTTEPTAICTAYVEREFASEAAADSDFKELVANAKNDGAQKFDGNDPAVARVLSNYENAAKGLGNGVSVSVSGATVLGGIGEGNNYYAGSFISAYTWSNGSQSAMMPFATAVAWIRMGTRIVKVSASYPFSDRQSIFEANDTLLNWLRVVTLEIK